MGMAQLRAHARPEQLPFFSHHTKIGKLCDSFGARRDWIESMRSDESHAPFFSCLHNRADASPAGTNEPLKLELVLCKPIKSKKLKK